MRRRIAALLALAAVAVVPLVLISDDDGRTSPRTVRASLGWAGVPQVTKVPELPRDRILTGRLANESLRPAELDVDRVRLVDARGRDVRSTARFLSNFAHGLFSAESINLYGKPGDGERRRLGEIATVKPGESVPITLSWRVPSGAAAPIAVDFGGSTVELP